MDFSKIAKPFYKILEKDAKFVWDKVIRATVG